MFVQFLIALSVFFLLHTIPANHGLRTRLVSAMGYKGYMAAYATVSILTLLWVFAAALQVQPVPVWPAAPWQAWVTIIFTPIGFFFLIAGLFSRNPLSITLAGGGRAGAIISITRHPTLWGFVLWSGSHIVANGDVRALILFGAMLVFSLIGMPLSDRRAQRRMGDGQWRVRSVQTSIIPFAAIIRRRARLRVDAVMGISLALTLVVTAWLLLGGGHAMLFGADPLAAAGV